MKSPAMRENILGSDRTERFDMEKSSDKSSSPQVLYRFFDAQDRLLYVGISNNFFGRVGQHKTDKDWFHEIAYSTFEHFPNRGAVERAETKAILSENPLYNKLKQPDFVPVEYHAKQIDMGTIYKSKRFSGHDWIKPYVAQLRFRAADIKNPRDSRIWLVATAYALAKADGYWCRSCEGFLTHAKLPKISITK